MPLVLFIFKNRLEEKDKVIDVILLLDSQTKKVRRNQSFFYCEFFHIFPSPSRNSSLILNKEM